MEPEVRVVIDSGEVVGGCTCTAAAEWSGLPFPAERFQLSLVCRVHQVGCNTMYVYSREQSGWRGCVKMSMVIERADWWIGGKDRMRESGFSLSQAMYVKQSQEGEE